jgi:hypothetical protein
LKDVEKEKKELQAKFEKLEIDFGRLNKEKVKIYQYIKVNI